MPVPGVLVVSLSARALAQAARRCGYAVYAIDLFGDCDTRAASVIARVVPPNGAGLDRDALLAAARDIATAHRPDFIVCGSGLESAPELLEDLERLAPVLGNDARTVRAVVQPATLFPALRGQRIDFPETVIAGTIPADGWLEKEIGGCGGAHVRAARGGRPISAGHYAQRRVQGVSMSALMLADGSDNAELVGSCRHWCAQPDLLTPYQHSGLVTEPSGGDSIGLLSQWCVRLARAFGLRGLCGFDFVLVQPGRPLLVDVNPRPPASFELFETDPPSAFSLHVQACQGRLRRPAPVAGSRAQIVFYAPRVLTIPVSGAWPEWVADVPPPGARITAGSPLCTIRGEGADAEQAIEVVRRRCRQLAALVRETMAAESD
ncbi:MAG: ATP-grasp domain-containing protein [Gammaproteobacteria bacterium]